MAPEGKKLREQLKKLREQLPGADPTPLTTSDTVAVDVPTKPNLKFTNPNLFISLITFAIISIAIAVNFQLTTPTFQQYGIPKEALGAAFGSIGLAQLFFLLVWRKLKAVRIAVVLNIAAMVFWGIGTTQTFFEGTSSLQLCVLYFGLAALQVPLLMEPYFNPVTAIGNGANGNRRKP